MSPENEGARSAETAETRADAEAVRRFLAEPACRALGSPTVAAALGRLVAALTTAQHERDEWKNNFAKVTVRERLRFHEQRQRAEAAEARVAELEARPQTWKQYEANLATAHDEGYEEGVRSAEARVEAARQEGARRAEELLGRAEAALTNLATAGDWYRRCLEDVADRRVVRGLGEAKAVYDSAFEKARAVLADLDGVTVESATEPSPDEQGLGGESEIRPCGAGS